MNTSKQSNGVQKLRRGAPRALIVLSLAMVGLGWAALPSGVVRAQVSFQRITGKTFDGAVPREFVLETFAIPVEKRNAALIKTPQGSRLLFALLDTSGYSSQVQQKYIGMIIAEGKVRICGHWLGTGSYGFGLTKPVPAGPGPAEFKFYDQAGIQLASCPAARDEKLQQPRPLQVQWNGQTEARLYVGRYWAAFR
ncbi:MAG TPA: hypothetical protein VMX16_17360 [Terriglobia bacterium]|nr:hypothetical protein [Terriglobia bacterium]